MEIGRERQILIGKPFVSYPAHKPPEPKTMKAVVLLCALFVLSAVSLSGSAKDSILEMYPYEPSSDGQKTPPSVITKKPLEDSERQSYVPNCILVADYWMFASKHQERDLKALESKFTKVQKISAFDPESFKFVPSLNREGSLLYNVMDTAISLEETYRKLRGGIDASVFGQPLTIYPDSKIIWRLDRLREVVFDLSGQKSVSLKIRF
jgi:hypothetical protein